MGNAIQLHYNGQAISFEDINQINFQSFCKEKSDMIRKIRVDYSIPPIAIQQFSMATWSSLKILQLNQNLIGPQACKYISRTSMKCLQVLNLYDNQIGSSGVLHLSKSNWRNIQKLNMSGTKIGPQSVKCLSKGRWGNISSLNIQYNNLQSAQKVYLMLYPFDELIYFEFTAQFVRRDRQNIILRDMFKKKLINAKIAL